MSHDAAQLTNGYVLVANPYDVDDMTHAVVGPFVEVRQADAEARKLGLTTWCVRPLHAPTVGDPCPACGHYVCPAPDCIRYGVTAVDAARCTAYPEICHREGCRRCAALAARPGAASQQPVGAAPTGQPLASDEQAS